MAENNTVAKLTYSVQEAGQALGIGRNSAYEAVRAGLIPSVRIGKRLVVPRAGIERLLEQAGGRSVDR